MKNIFLFKPETHLSRWMIGLLVIVVLILGALNYLDPVKEFLDSEAMTLKLGSFSISLYHFLKAVLALIVLFWTAGIISAAGEKYIRGLKSIKASNRALLIKGFQTLIYFIMFMMGLDLLGIDLTAFAVLGGAIGIGIGFGLQKITSNFISGLILLFEKSVEEGDLVELSDGTAGYIRNTGARYTLLETFDSREVMIPNEDFITNRVTNWTFTNNQGRIEITVGVSYDSDLDKVKELILEAAKEHPRCSKKKDVDCFLTNFGNSSIDFLLYFWVDDVIDGRLGPKSDVMFSIWRKFKEHKIEIPFPQMDLHVKNPELFK